ncbi:MAG: C25 family cysteine peptidase, partial [Gemmatimonadota bacterium]|nr:C25 family cysteine peptidase [Gemmatimonadota bacterium]
LKYAFENWAVPPEFVLFFGDGNNDFRGGTASGRARANYILPFIDANDLALEEWFVRFTDKDLPQIAHGRLPVQNENEAAVVVDKIINYERGADPGDWVRRAVLVADDGYILGGKCDPAAAFTHFETACENLDSLLPGDLERIKVYLQQYPFDPPGIGTRKPAATDDLLKWWNRGALIVNYFGHGSELHWAQERAFDVERDLPMLTNGYRLPLLLNASCSIGHFDDYRAESMVERVIAFGGGGAVAAYAGTRITFSQRNNELSRLFVDALFSPGRDSNTIGASALVARLAMNGTWGGANAQRYSIFGDPAMCLHDPARTLLFQLEGRGPSYKMGEKVSFTGTVVKKNNETDNLFSGVARIKFLGGTASPVEIAYECTDDGNIVRERSTSFVPQQMVIFDGPVTVTGGHFSGNLVLPLNLAGSMPGDTLSMETGRFIGYATCPSADGSGASVSIPVASHSGAYSDTSAPRISLIRPGLGELRNGDKVSISEPLLLVINDESGINTTGRPGVQLSLEVDEGTTYSADLTGQFSYRQDSYQEGTVTVELAAVEPGLHAFRFRATDNLLNSATAEWMLQVAGTAESLTLSGVMNYPNPFRDRTDICFEVSGPANVLVRIFTVAGRPVRELVKNGLAAGFNTVGWDGADEYGHKIANGVYIYKIICMPLTKSLSNDTKEVVAIGKALLSR